MHKGQYIARKNVVTGLFEAIPDDNPHIHSFTTYGPNSHSQSLEYKGDLHTHTFSINSPFKHTHGIIESEESK